MLESVESSYTEKNNGSE